MWLSLCVSTLRRSCVVTDRAYLTNVSVTSSFAAEINSTDRANNVFVLSLELVDEVTLFVFEVEITLGTVIV